MNGKVRSLVTLTFLFALLTLASCGMSKSQGVRVEEPEQEAYTTEFEGKMELSYATEFAVESYEGYPMITIADDDRFLLVSENTMVPENLPEDVCVLRQPLKQIYLVSSSAMDYFLSLDGLEALRFSGTKESGWYLEEATQAMESGRLLYAGKYSAPDYELLLSEGCDLAIENTMIQHSPQVKEQLRKLGIPVLVEYSSYEPEPLGRLEWIKLYGLLLGKYEEAETIYEGWLEELAPFMEQENTGRTVAFFYINSNGAVNVRKTKDYIAKLISLAGGEYIFDTLDAEEENALSTVNIQMEEFYQKAKDADYLIYNATVDDGISSMEDLLKKSELFKDFKAVGEGHVYSTGRNFYQESTGMGRFVQELHGILMDETQDMHYFEHIE